jgi:L-cysteine S-thiosulfotransferase
MEWRMAAAGICLAAAMSFPALADGVAPFVVTGDAINQPLGGRQGDAQRGRRVALDREVANCLACHRLPEPAERFQGELGPDLTGVGRRLTEGQLRLRIVDQAQINPRTIMPPYHRVDGLKRVADKLRGKPVLAAAEVEDLVAYLASLRE